jgi:hypothetical protein
MARVLRPGDLSPAAIAGLAEALRAVTGREPVAAPT